MNEVKKEYRRKVNFVYVEMSRPSGKNQARKEGVMGTPTFLFYDKDGELVYRIQGSQSREVLEQHLDRLLEKE